MNENGVSTLRFTFEVLDVVAQATVLIWKMHKKMM